MRCSLLIGMGLGLCLLVASACSEQTKPKPKVVPVPTPEELCEAFVLMVQRERPLETPPLTQEWVQLKYQECLKYNSQLQIEKTVEYNRVARCSIPQPRPVNWARCLFSVDGSES